MIELNQNDTYYFLSLNNARFYTLFVGRLEEELVYSIIEYFNTSVAYNNFELEFIFGEHRFVLSSNKPVYLLNIQNVAALNFGGDNELLETFPSGNIPVDCGLQPKIYYPTYWDSKIEPLLDFKIADSFYLQKGGAWIPLVT